MTALVPTWTAVWMRTSTTFMTGMGPENTQSHHSCGIDIRLQQSLGSPLKIVPLQVVDVWGERLRHRDQ